MIWLPAPYTCTRTHTHTHIHIHTHTHTPLALAVTCPSVLGCPIWYLWAAPSLQMAFEVHKPGDCTWPLKVYVILHIASLIFLNAISHHPTGFPGKSEFSSDSSSIYDWLIGWGLGLRASNLQSRHSTIWATPPVHFAFIILEMGISLFVWAG
jgi:hypothetical protein